MEAAGLMKKAILLSGLNLNSCLTYASVRQLFWGDYEMQVSFIPECSIGDIANRATKLYDLVIGIDYKTFFTKDSLATENSQLIMLSRTCNQRKNDFVPILFGQKLEADALEITNNVGKIVKEKINQSFHLDPFLESRYLKARLIINLFYGLTENVKFHTEFLLELIEQAESPWINHLFEKHKLTTIN